MSLYTVQKYTASDKDQWDACITASINGTFLFNRDFMDYHSDRFMDHSLLVYKDEILVAVLPAHRNEAVLYSHQGLTYGGLVYKKDLKFKGVVEVFKVLLTYLESQNIERLMIKAIPSVYYKTDDGALDYLMTMLNASIVRSDILSVIQPAKSTFAKDRMAGFKRGLKHNLIVKETDDLSEFWNTLLIPNLDKKYKSKPVHSLEEISRLKSKFPSQIRQFNVYYNDELVAGTTIFETDTVARSQYISSNALKNKLGSLDYLHGYLLNDVFKNKPYFDFGASSLNSGKQINEGLLYWKLGFGASILAHNFYEIKTQNHHLLKNIFI